MVALVRFPSDSNLYATAKPPASSPDRFIFFPEESLSKLDLSESFARLKLNDAVVALALLFTTIGICRVRERD
jgi:hypothetical protein